MTENAEKFAHADSSGISAIHRIRSFVACNYIALEIFNPGRML